MPLTPAIDPWILVVGAALLGLVAIGGVVTLLRRRRGRPGRLGPYTLERKLGEGGMGEVYLGHHALLRRPTAIKTLGRGSTDAEALGRFEQEVQLTALLRHPCTVAVYDYGRTRGGRFYYAMEYLTGASLDKIVRTTGWFHEGRTIHVLRQLCGSLSEAHGIRLIHRDIKPSNLILCVRGGVYDWLKVVDFGLVKDVGNDLDARLGSEDTITGTPLYMAPEALRPKFRHDGRQDIYAMGAVGYYMLTGTHVFPGTDQLAVLKQHVQDTPERPSERAGRPIEPTLEALILQCLEKKPEKRPPTAGALLHALDACPDVGAWTSQAAQAWWIQNEAALDLPEPLPHAEATAGFFALSSQPR